MAARNEPTGPSDREIVVTRVFDSPREQVFAAWTHPNHLSHWFGPRGFTLTTSAFEFRPGGVWRFVMHGPDGVDYPNKIVFLEIDSPHRLIYKHPGDDGAEPMQCQTTVSFVDQGGQTELTLRMEFATAAERDRVAEKYGAIKGGEETLERLGEHLAEVTRTGREVVITRVFDAPADLVFQTWTDAKHVARWWGPKGFTNPVCEWDARPGGRIHIDMTGPDGVVYPMKGVFHEIVAPERIVYTTSVFEDAQGRPRLEVRHIITFASQDGKTILTVQNVILTVAPELAGAVAGMETGWSQSLEKLAELLEAERCEFVG